MAAPADDLLRMGYAEAVRVVEAARVEADAIRADAERHADLVRVRAEAEASARRNEGDLYLEKARAVLEIAQARARLAPAPGLVDLEAEHGRADAEIDVAMAVARQLDIERGISPGPKLPGEMDRLLREAVENAIRTTLPRPANDSVSTG